MGWGSHAGGCCGGTEPARSQDTTDAEQDRHNYQTKNGCCR